MTQTVIRSDRLKALVLRAITALLLTSVYTLVYNWGNLDFRTLEFVRQSGLLLHLIYTAICFQILTILSMSMQNHRFDVFALAYSCELYLFLLVYYDSSVYLATGILGLLLFVIFLAAPYVKDIHAEKINRPYIIVFLSLLLPLVLLIFYRLFSTPVINSFFTQKDAGINLMTQILLAAFFGSAVGVLLFEWKLGLDRPPFRKSFWSISAITLTACMHVLLVGGILAYRYWGLRTPTFDFGLFAQMFANMNATGLPMTTLERNQTLSHFAVHLSPIYYLMLPFYWIWPDPVVLQILQPIIVISGLVPLLLLARHYRLAKGWHVVLAIIYATHPGLVGSSMYDLHENCFLAPLILWVLYFLARKKKVPFIIFSLFVLAVKEDAALYLAAIALFAGIDRDRRRYGILLGVLATGYFILALYLLDRYGTGPMTGRFDSLTAHPDLGLLSVPLTIIQNPGFLLSQVFSESKLIYLFKMLMPVGFVPLLNRRLTSWPLLLPFLVMNLIMAYPFQHNLRYQYHYGSAVLLIFLLLIQIAGTCHVDEAAPLPDKKQISKADYPSRRALTQAIGIGVITSLLFGGFIISDNARYYRFYYRDLAQVRQIKSVLDELPEDTSIQASTFLTAYLSPYDSLYDIEKNMQAGWPNQTEYAVVDQRGLNGPVKQEMIDALENQQYRLIEYHEGVIAIYRKMAMD